MIIIKLFIKLFHLIVALQLHCNVHYHCCADLYFWYHTPLFLIVPLSCYCLWRGSGQFIRWNKLLINWVFNLITTINLPLFPLFDTINHNGELIFENNVNEIQYKLSLRINIISITINCYFVYQFTIWYLNWNYTDYIDISDDLTNNLL